MGRATLGILVRSRSRRMLVRPDEAMGEVHAFERLGKKIVFNVETLFFYEADPVTFDLISSPVRGDLTGLEPLIGRHGLHSVRNAVERLRAERFIRATTSSPRVRALPRPRRPRSLELMVTHRCNLRCRYCYGSNGSSDWADASHLYGDDGGDMSFETAARAVDWLIGVSGGQNKLNLVFFGGEPLLVFPLIRRIVEHADGRGRATDKSFSYSLSTNGLGLTEEVVDFLEQYRIGCQVSIDGPPSVHDRWRVAADGRGSYDRAIEGIRRLIARRPGRVPARATFSHDSVHLPEVVSHLFELGFGSVHVEPALGLDPGSCISEADLKTVEVQNEQLAALLIDRVRMNRIFHYTNLVRNVRQTRVVRNRRQHHCGAGRTYLAVSRDGSIFPCHRFVGLEDYRMGHVDEGLRFEAVERFHGRTVDRRPGCAKCWARYLCGGGCWKHAHDTHGNLDRPDEDRSCRIQKHLIECAMAVNTELRVQDAEILADAAETSVEPQFADA